MIDAVNEFETPRHSVRQAERDAAPIAVARHGRPVVVVLSVEEYEWLKALERAGAGEADQSAGKADSE